MSRTYRAIGLMSGTSLDGVDVALIETDGMTRVESVACSYRPYNDDLREKIRSCFGAREKSERTDDVERDLTVAHINAVKGFMAAHNLEAGKIDVIGFHGQTITHDPENGFTWQLGDGEKLARETGIKVVNDFRTADIAAGGEGAPLIPVYHRARAVSSGVAFPVAILNIGGVSNVTWIGEREEDILAFDCGPGNALIDDLLLKTTGERYDSDGRKARAGTVDKTLLSHWLLHPFFDETPPKSLDRGAWNVEGISSLTLEDAAATLTEFTVQAIARGAEKFPSEVKAWYVTGGGRKNSVVMDGLARALGTTVNLVDDLGWNGDALEAEGFAYMAVRSLLGLPISFPGTTGVPNPCCGGKANAA